jgi:cell division protease FtsH
MIPNENQVCSIGVLGFWVYLMYKMIKIIQDQHSLKVKKKDPNGKVEGKTFDDVGGNIKAKEAIREIIDFLRHKEDYKNLGVRMPRGILLHGPPGTGKTLIAKVAATEAGIPVIYASGSEFVELFVGLGAKRVRELFCQARALERPVMIFIDEIDAIGYKR